MNELLLVATQWFESHFDLKNNPVNLSILCLTESSFNRTIKRGNPSSCKHKYKYQVDNNT